MNAPIFEYNFIVHTFCRVKEKTERAKKARALISNRSKIKNFVIELEMNDKTIYERVDNGHHKKALSKAVKLLYSNYLDIILSNFNALGLEIRDGSPSDIVLERINGYIDAKKFVISYKLYDRWLEDYEIDSDSSRMRMNPVYADTGKMDEKSFFNSYPNFCLIFRDVTLKLDYFIQLLHKIKREFSNKNMKDIYNYALDIFIEFLEKKSKASKKYLAVSISNLATIIYYNFGIMFRHDNKETAFLSFKEIGWSWKPLDEKKEVEIYIHDEYDEVKEIILEKLSNCIKKEYSVSQEYVQHVIGYILYQCIVELVIIAREEYNKTLNEMFFDDLMTGVVAHMKHLRGYDYSKTHFIAIPKDTKGFSLLSKQKGISTLIDHLFSIAKEGKLEETEEEMHEDTLCIHFLRSERNHNTIYIEILYYDAWADKYEHLILIRIQNQQEYYIIGTTVYSDFYLIGKEFFNDILSYPSISNFLEEIGINKHNFEFVLRNIEAEFVNFA